MSFSAPRFTGPAPTAAALDPAANLPPPGAASNEPIFEDSVGSATSISINGGSQTTRSDLRTTVYVAADGGPPIVVRDSIDIVTTFTRQILRGVIVGDSDSDSDSDSAMDVSVSSSDTFPADPIRALAAAYAAAHSSATSAHRSTAATAAGPSRANASNAANTTSGAGANVAGPSGSGQNGRSAAATRIRPRTFIGPRRPITYVPSSGSEDDAGNLNAATEDEAAAPEDEAAATSSSVCKGKGKARDNDAL